MATVETAAVAAAVVVATTKSRWDQPETRCTTNPLLCNGGSPEKPRSVTPKKGKNCPSPLRIRRILLFLSILNFWFGLPSGFEIRCLALAFENIRIGAVSTFASGSRRVTIRYILSPQCWVEIGDQILERQRVRASNRAFVLAEELPGFLRGNPLQSDAYCTSLGWFAPELRTEWASWNPLCIARSAFQYRIFKIMVEQQLTIPSINWIFHNNLWWYSYLIIIASTNNLCNYNRAIKVLTEPSNTDRITLRVFQEILHTVKIQNA